MIHLHIHALCSIPLNFFHLFINMIDDSVIQELVTCTVFYVVKNKIYSQMDSSLTKSVITATVLYVDPVL